MCSDEEYYGDLLNEKTKECELLEEKIDNLYALLEESDKKINDIITEMKKIQENIGKAFNYINP